MQSAAHHFQMCCTATQLRTNSRLFCRLLAIADLCQPSSTKVVYTPLSHWKSEYQSGPNGNVARKALNDYGTVSRAGGLQASRQFLRGLRRRGDVTYYVHPKCASVRTSKEPPSRNAVVGLHLTADAGRRRRLAGTERR